MIMREGTVMGAYQHIIFDLDGTLVDTNPDLVGTVNYILEKYHFEKKSRDFIRNSIGGGARNLLLRCIGNDHTDIIDNELLGVFSDYYAEHCSIDSKVYPGVMDTLKALEDKNKNLSVATFKIRTATDRIFKDFKMQQFFDIVVTADDVKRPKPNPDCLEKIMQFYDCAPSDTILIGDTKNDSLTAKNAGVDFCAVSYGYGDTEELKSFNPKYLINDFSELVDLV